MGLSRAFGLLLVTLCLTACLCAHAFVTKEEAQQAVTSLQKLILKTLDKAQQRYVDAKRVEKNGEAQKKRAEKAASEAETTATGNEEAKSFAEKAKSEMQGCLQLHPDAQTKAKNAVPVMEDLMNKARALDKDAEINVEPKEGSGDDYTHVTQSVEAVEVKRNDLESEIKAAKPQLEAAEAAFDKLSNHADKAEVAKDKVKAVVAVAQMNTLLSQADADITSIQEKKDKVNATVKEIGEIVKEAPEKVILKIIGISDQAEADLRQIIRILKKVQEDKDAMLVHKNSVDESLEQIKTLTGVSNVRAFLRSITTSAGQAAQSLKKINRALQSADVHVKNSDNRKQEMQDLLSPKSSKPTDTDTAAPMQKKPDQPAKDGTKKSGDKEGISALGGSSDSAITVSLSLLLAFISCAALH